MSSVFAAVSMQAAAPHGVADIVVYLVSDAAALVSGVVVPACGA